MKNILKLLFVSLLIPLLFTACKDELDTNWTKPEPSFKLYDTTLGSNVLYPTMANNPFVLTWDNAAGAGGQYNVVISATEDFKTKVQLGTSTTTALNTKISTLNTAMLQAGLNPYIMQKAYIRVEAGNAVSNSISFLVTPYPDAKPIIKNPTSGTSFTLDPTSPNTVITTVKWDDYTAYGVDVVYNIGITKKGGNVFQDAGSTTNLRSFDWTNKSLNDAALKTGAAAGVEAEFDIRVTATTKPIPGSTIVTSSDVVTVKITPYVNNVTLYLIGNATAAGWDNSAGNPNMFPLLGDHNVNTKYTYTGYFKDGGFKLIKDKGSWDAQYGAGSSAGTLDSSGGSGNINVTTAGYYTFTADVSTMTYTLTPVANPTTTYATIGIIGDSTPNGWGGSTAMTQSTFDTHIWYMTNVSLTSGELKFRANDSWDVNWGSSDTDFGTGTPGGPNIPVQAGTYNIYFNDYSGAYVLIKQ